MQRPPALVIHGIVHARRALGFGLPVTLLSAPGAASYAGAAWWRGVVAAAGGGAPDILDCGTAPGRALEALACGCRALVLGACPAFATVADRAALAGAVILTERPEALDLAQVRHDGSVLDWLTR